MFEKLGTNSEVDFEHQFIHSDKFSPLNFKTIVNLLISSTGHTHLYSSSCTSLKPAEHSFSLSPPSRSRYVFKSPPESLHLPFQKLANLFVHMPNRGTATPTDPENNLLKRRNRSKSSIGPFQSPPDIILRGIWPDPRIQHFVKIRRCRESLQVRTVSTNEFDDLNIFLDAWEMNHNVLHLACVVRADLFQDLGYHQRVAPGEIEYVLAEEEPLCFFVDCFVHKQEVELRRG